MVSPKLLSDLVPDVTLIAFPIPRRDSPRGGRAFSSREPSLVSRRENDLILILRANSGANLNLLFGSLWSGGVLDGCSQPRNQQPYENLLIHWQGGGF
jgi:hypothetical protein